MKSFDHALEAPATMAGKKSIHLPASAKQAVKATDGLPAADQSKVLSHSSPLQAMYVNAPFGMLESPRSLIGALAE